MDESILYPDVSVRIPLPIPEGPERENLSRLPHMMLSISLSRRERLPEDLHQSMVMWSFHPDFHDCTRMYFQWVSIVEQTNKKSFLQEVAKKFFTWPVFLVYFAAKGLNLDSLRIDRIFRADHHGTRQIPLRRGGDQRHQEDHTSARLMLLGNKKPRGSPQSAASQGGQKNVSRRDHGKTGKDVPHQS